MQINKNQLLLLEQSFDYLKKIKIDKLRQADPEYIETACGTIFLTRGWLFNIINDIKNTS